MADEDAMPRTGLQGEDVDLSDETQDFRFLASISEDAAIPKRGEKDFEPHATALQSNTLASSRQAMHNALSFQRTHAPKAQTIGLYHPESNMCYINNPKGAVFTRMGHVRSAKDDPFGDDESRGQRLWLLPEEALWLLERGTLDVRWPVMEDDASSDLGLPMSLQGAYAAFIGDEESHGQALTLERYSVYANLKRTGYIVMRAPTWAGLGPPQASDCYAPKAVQTWRTGLSSLASVSNIFYSLYHRDDPESQQQGPLVQPGLYRDYETIYRRLALISFYDPSTQTAPDNPTTAETDPGFRITYHVWKPGSTTFKKSQPGIPDFRIAVINARETAAPSLQQLSALMETAPYEPPKSDAQMFMQLKNGYKHVILAVVDQGVTSYLRLADAAFGHHKIFERKPARGGGGKRGGRGGARGRGRGRGR